MEGRFSNWQDQQTSPNSTAAYLYDGEGNRVAQQVTSAGSTTTTVYVGNLEEASTTGGVTTTTTYYYANGWRFAMAVSGVFKYLASDGLGSANVSLDAAGYMIASVLYAPYGSARYNSGTMPTDHGFTGQIADSTSGLDYYGARYYDPVAGQFISADSILPGAGFDIWGFSRYAYVEGNPIIRTDSLGNASVIDGGGGCHNGNPACGNGDSTFTTGATSTTSAASSKSSIPGVMDFGRDPYADGCISAGTCRALDVTDRGESGWNLPDDCTKALAICLTGGTDMAVLLLILGVTIRTGDNGETIYGLPPPPKVNKQQKPWPKGKGLCSGGVNWCLLLAIATLIGVMAGIEWVNRDQPPLGQPTTGGSPVPHPWSSPTQTPSPTKPKCSPTVVPLASSC